MSLVTRFACGLKRVRQIQLLVIGLAMIPAALAPALALQGDSITYEYDELGRLISADYSNQADQAYSYDPDGNRTTVTISGLAPADFTINDPQANEDQNLVFTITRTDGLATQHTIDYASANGTATAGADYTSASGTLTFAVNDTSKQVTVIVANDGDPESDETVMLNLSNASGDATISDAQGQGMIMDDDGPPSFSVDDVSVTEGGSLQFTVTRSTDNSSSYSVDYATANGTASAGADYTAASGTLTFASGESSKTVNIATSDDTTDETAETLTLTLSNPTGGSSIEAGEGIGTGTINDNDNEPIFSVDDVSVGEGGNLVFTVTKSGTTTQSFSVDYATSNGTAQSADYTNASGTLSFSSSEVTKTVSVATTQDAIDEANQTINLTLSGATGGATVSGGPGVGTINDDDAAPTFSISDDTVNEANTLEFIVTRNGATELSYDISYASAHNTSDDSDFTSVSGTLAIGAGTQTGTINVVPIDNNVDEAGVSMFLNLTGASGGATFTDSQGLGTIYDNDPPPTFAVNDVSVTEGGNLSFTITKTGASSKNIKVTYATANGTAGSADYSAESGDVTFAFGEATKTVTVATTQDTTDEASETVLLNLVSVNHGASFTDNQGVGTINDNDAGPSFSVNDNTKGEGQGLVFTVTKAGATEQSYTVNYATSNGTAETSDYTATSGTLSFASGETSKLVTVPTVNDTIDEDNETVNFTLSGASGGSSITDAQGLGTINDNDAGSSFSVNNVSVTEGGNLVFTVTKAGATEKSYNVSYATANGTAGASEYTSTSGALTFTSTQTSKTVTVSTNDDGLDEANETVLLNLSNATNGASISDSQGVGTMNDDDESPVAVNDSTSMSQGTYKNVAVLNNDSDGDNDPLSVTSVTQPSNAFVTIQSGGVLRVNSSSTGTDTFTYTVSDGNGNTDVGTVTVTVTGGGGGGPPLF